ncbi:hypothetical protein PGT21_021675 [Puccinia graminis f. sp. tritici]|uniref:Uncharacterized protein n=1 Tax=Puccinia graminis f. sp. tritici TaxID=56615 RepID=A0A5B0LU60_PUCGR|nr:hypothetical protein PGT21_021675 [Puccinia graminis f. sp. tritici]KAA1091726.1 hypothetical protein PGTUg99_005991 [Puccinia graminis f. sp. tritici]
MNWPPSLSRNNHTLHQMFRTDSEKERFALGSFRHPVPPPANPPKQETCVKWWFDKVWDVGDFAAAAAGLQSLQQFGMDSGVGRGHPTKTHVESLGGSRVGRGTHGLVWPAPWIMLL